MTASPTLLDVRGLRTVFHTVDGAYAAVDGVDLAIGAGEVVGLVGESGSGKSVTGFSLMRLVDAPGEIVAGVIDFKSEDLLQKSEEEMRAIRGDRIAMIFQDPLMTLNPVLTIGKQMAEAVTEHRDISRREALTMACRALRQVGIASPEQRLKQHPHEFSGGMRQRVAIAISMLNQPDLIIADEPTTALDVTIQGQILYEMQQVCASSGTALLWITHDLGVVAELVDRIAVMYSGRIVETGSADQVLDDSRHPYTRGLLASVPTANEPGRRLAQIEGAAPALAQRPIGCAFRPRCPNALGICAEEDPEPTFGPDGRSWRCFNPVGQGDSA